MDLAEAFLNNCYTYVEGENENGVPFCSYTDELFHRTGYATEVYTLGNVSCDNYNVGFRKPEVIHGTFIIVVLKR